MFKLFVIIITLNSQGQEVETLNVVSDVSHKDKLSCYVEKQQYKDIDNHLIYFCGDESLYKKK